MLQKRCRRCGLEPGGLIGAWRAEPNLNKLRFIVHRNFALNLSKFQMHTSDCLEWTFQPWTFSTIDNRRVALTFLFAIACTPRRAKLIKNKPRVNSERGRHELESLLQKSYQECDQLRAQLLMSSARLRSLNQGSAYIVLKSQSE